LPEHEALLATLAEVRGRLVRVRASLLGPVPPTLVKGPPAGDA
jgi:hypothetical protein